MKNPAQQTNPMQPSYLRWEFLWLSGCCVPSHGKGDAQRCKGKLKGRMHPHPRRRGATAVEMAIVLPLLLVLVFGIIEFGRAMMVQQILVNTAREATRRAVIPGATDEQVYQIIDGYLANAGIDEFDVILELDDAPHDLEEGIENGELHYSDSIENAHSKTRVGIEVSVLHEDVAWGPLRMIASDRRISSNMILMRKE